ncbi:MAG: 2-oxoacid:ferredoxin oxidoreductase subunit beta [Candidatus Zixiibacteriota bacterium]
MEELSLIHGYLRQNKKFPAVWCPGCGAGAIMNAILRTVKKLEWDKNDIVMVSGIGCSSRMPTYVDFNTLHTTHGRAIPYATGIKLSKPKLNVIVITGDGDGLAIGGNHFIHACRRNIDLTVVVVNNWIYGMTGGQVSPTTPEGKFAHTAPYGSIDPPFDISKMAAASGASFVARSTVYSVVQMTKHIEGGMRHNGLSIVEVMSPCPELFGRLNNQRSAVCQLEYLKDKQVPLAKWNKMKPEERKEGQFPVGIFVHEERPEYCTSYFKMARQLQKEAGTEDPEELESNLIDANDQISDSKELPNA